MANIKNLNPKYLTEGINPQHTLETFDEDGNVNMLVEIPIGSINKYEFVTEANIIKLDRVNPAKMPYPIEYGLLPKTWDKDNDLLDVMSLINYPTFPGCLIAGRVIGVLYFVDGGETDDKIMVVPADDFHFKHIKSIEDINEAKKLEIEFFWKHYKDVLSTLKNKTISTEVTGWGNVDKAMKVIEESKILYREKFPQV